ncbi:MAG: hypothetical protein ALECFALPRED_007055 [Alectoria fallacina]|uniref:Uncharacterized protein n=1 Tax=Alectoria fallacina TaxID=1903189 RepID=A0A8H3ICH2_9LECA|nr:MAG: hypothetical protein ALECFALPRED_007055 [Alectoria fallacina]
MPLSILVSDGDPSNAFHDQFSTIIRLESRLQGDHSEDIIGPARQRWVVRHLIEVARAQRFTSQRPTAQTSTLNVHAPEFFTPSSTRASTLNVHAPEFVTPPPAQATTISRSERVTPWYEHFNLADQGLYFDSFGPQPRITPFNRLSRHPSPYTPFNPAELAGYRAVVRAQLLQSSESQHNAPSGQINHTPDSFIRPSPTLPHTQPPSTPPNNFPRVRYPSTPPNRPIRHRRHTPSTDSDSLPELLDRSTLRASTEPIVESAGMGTLTAPEHYQPFEIYALEVQRGDFIQSVKNPGEVMDHYPCDALDYEPIGENEARPVNANGGLRIQFKGADGTIRAKVFKGLDKVRVLREVAKDDDDDAEAAEEEVKKEGQ